MVARTPHRSCWLTPAGLERSVGIISGAATKDPTDRRWDNDPGMNEWRAFMNKHYPAGDLADSNDVSGYGAAFTPVHVPRQCGNNLTPGNVMRQAASLRDFTGPTSLPGIKLNTSPTNFAPTKSMQLVQFDGKTWVPLGDVLGL